MSENTKNARKDEFDNSWSTDSKIYGWYGLFALQIHKNVTSGLKVEQCDRYVHPILKIYGT